MELALISSNDTVLECIRNGMIVDGIGHRAVAFMVDDKTNIIRIRNMISQKSLEKIHGWNTSVQAIRDGDYVAISSWVGKAKPRIQVYRKTVKGLFPSQKYGGSLNSSLIPRLPKSIVGFLDPRGGGPSYLPTGYWRSNYDMLETNNRKQIEDFLSPFLKGDWLEFTVDEAMKSPSQHLITTWSSRHVKKLPTKITNHMEYWTQTKDPAADAMVYNSMVWVLVHQDGTTELVEPKPTSGHEYVGPSRRIVETFNELPKGMPTTVVRALQINLGAYERDERSYGARWFLYER